MTLLWSSDFEGALSSEWGDTTQAPLGTIVTAATAGLGGPTAPRSGSKFWQAHIQRGMTPIFSGERCDLIAPSAQNVAIGDERWYGMSAWYPPVANYADAVNGVEWHSGSNAANEGQACVQMTMAPNPAGINFSYTNANPGLLVAINGGHPNANGQQWPIVNTLTGGAGGLPWTSMIWDLGPYSNWTGRWLDILSHILFKADGTGTFELWIKNATDSVYTNYVSQVGNVCTIYADAGNYIKLPLYRNAGWASGADDGYAWYDAIKLGTTQADVAQGSIGGVVGARSLLGVGS